jgi:hypothetical protein
VSNQRARNNRRAVIVLIGMIFAAVQGIWLVSKFDISGSKRDKGPGQVLVGMFGYPLIEVRDIPHDRYRSAYDHWVLGGLLFLIILAIGGGAGVSWFVSRLWPPPGARAESTDE